MLTTGQIKRYYDDIWTGVIQIYHISFQKIPALNLLIQYNFTNSKNYFNIRFRPLVFTDAVYNQLSVLDRIKKVDQSIRTRG